MSRIVFSKALVMGFALTLFLPGIGSAEDVSFSYNGDTAPQFWGSLQKSTGNLAFPACNGSEQSPINVDDVDESEQLTPIQTDYSSTPLEIENNGHTIEVFYEEGSTMTVNGSTYDLLMLHFHTPSEHTVEGESFPIEMHLVHRRDVGSGQVEFAVIGVLFQVDDYNPTLAKIFDNMPAEEGAVEVHGEEIDVNDLLPDIEEYQHYQGSFTTPPCTEGVQWFLAQETVEASAAQVSQLANIFANPNFPNMGLEPIGNNRPTQPLNGRVVLESDE